MMVAMQNVTTKAVHAHSRLHQRGRPSALTSAMTARSGRHHVLVRNDNQDGRITETDAGAASQEDASTVASSAGSSSGASGASGVSGSRLQTPEKEGFVKGQGTAIVTGAISIIFGVAYLALVSLLDVRGGELQPPPPEAFLN